MGLGDKKFVKEPKDWLALALQYEADKVEVDYDPGELMAVDYDPGELMAVDYDPGELMAVDLESGVEIDWSINVTELVEDPNEHIHAIYEDSTTDLRVLAIMKKPLEFSKGFQDTYD